MHQEPDPNDMATLIRSWPCLRLEGKGARQAVTVDVSVSPNAKRTELVGWHDGALRLRLAAPPVDGAANEALRKWLARELGLPVADVALIRGMSGRRKQLSLNAPPDNVLKWLSAQAVLQNARA